MRSGSVSNRLELRISLNRLSNLVEKSHRSQGHETSVQNDGGIGTSMAYQEGNRLY